MELHEAHELKEVYNAKDATDAIQQGGWRLLAVTSGMHPDAPVQRLGPCYVLGKRKSADPLPSGLRPASF